MLAELFSIIAPVFVCAAIGFSWAKAGWSFPAETIGRMIVTFGTPCLIFSNLTGIGHDPEALGVMTGAAVIAVTVFGLSAVVLLSVFRMSLRGYIPALMFPNAGNMGLPLCLFAFGETGLAFGIAYFLVTSIGQFTIGMAVASGSASLKTVFGSPVVYAVAAAAIMMFTDTDTPVWIANTTKLLGGMTIPLLLITLGVSLAELRVRALGISLVMSVVRLVIGFGIGVLLSDLFGFEGIERGVMILQSTMPVAVFSYIFAHQYKTKPNEVAGMVVISTLMCFALLPALLWYVLP